MHRCLFSPLGSRAQQRGPPPRLEPRGPLLKLGTEGLLSGLTQRTSSHAWHRGPLLRLGREGLLSDSIQRISSRAQERASSQFRRRETLLGLSREDLLNHLHMKGLSARAGEMIRDMGGGLVLGSPRGKGFPSVLKGPKPSIKLLQLPKNSPREVKRAHFVIYWVPPGPNQEMELMGPGGEGPSRSPRFLQPCSQHWGPKGPSFLDWGPKSDLEGIQMSSTILYLPTYKYLQGRRNVSQSEGASEASISSQVKTNLFTIDFYTDMCFLRAGESFSYKNCVTEKNKNFKNNFGWKVRGPWPPWPLPFLRLWIPIRNSIPDSTFRIHPNNN